MPLLNCYGENSFTFMFFSVFNNTNPNPKDVQDLFLKNLHQMCTGARFSEKELEKINLSKMEIWLFPNFGKGVGFGEPDALIIAEPFNFWIEVETYVNVRRRTAALAQTIRQLLRFHMLAEALKRGPTIIGGAYHAIQGYTFKDSGEPRVAIVKVARREFIKKLSKNKNEDHYVLFTESEPENIGNTDNGERIICRVLRDIINGHFGELISWLNSESVPKKKHPKKPKTDRFWYVYWKGQGLKSKIVKKFGDPLQKYGYVSRISR